MIDIGHRHVKTVVLSNSEELQVPRQNVDHNLRLPNTNGQINQACFIKLARGPLDILLRRFMSSRQETEEDIMETSEINMSCVPQILPIRL